MQKNYFKELCEQIISFKMESLKGLSREMDVAVLKGKAPRFFSRFYLYTVMWEAFWV